jgi:DNA-binding PadR family transcriptional regulator
MIAGKPARGYELITALEERTGGGYGLGPEAIYPTLTLLEEQGFASVTAGACKTLYRATAEGEAFLRANQAVLTAVQSRIGTLAPQRGAEPPAPIVRAAENLRTAVRLRLASGPVAADRVSAIAGAVDAAAAEAERV